MLVIWTRDVQATAADVVNSFVIHKEGAVRVLNRAVGGEDGVVRLNNRSGDTRRRVHSKLKLALLAVVCGETFEEQSAKPRSSTTTKRMEDQEALKRGAVVCT